jgi:hypothetical protein
MNKNILRQFTNIIYIIAIVLAFITVASAIPAIRLFPLDVALYIGYALIGLGILAALVFPIVGAVSNPRGAIKPVIGLLALVIIFVIGYSLSGAEPLMNPVTGEQVADGGRVQFAGAAIFLGIAAFLATVITFIAMEVISIFR